ncbi:MAG: RidA family protein [Treponema sp.]|nr:RidA family protein [Treponema sp.]
MKQLPKNALVEIEAIAELQNGH